MELRQVSGRPGRERRRAVPTDLERAVHRQGRRQAALARLRLVMAPRLQRCEAPHGCDGGGGCDMRD